MRLITTSNCALRVLWCQTHQIRNRRVVGTDRNTICWFFASIIYCLAILFIILIRFKMWNFWSSVFFSGTHHQLKLKKIEKTIYTAMCKKSIDLSSRQRLKLVWFSSERKFLFSGRSQNLPWKLGQQSATCWNSFGLFRDYKLNYIFLGIKLFFVFYNKKLNLLTSFWKRVLWNLTKFQLNHTTDRKFFWKFQFSILKNKKVLFL